MKVTRFLAAVAILGATASTSFAQSVSLTWDTCVGPIDKAVTPGSIAQANISVLGQTASHKAYDVRIMMISPGGVRDAWRFDAVGCQGSALIELQHLPPAAISKACPAFMGTSAPSLQIKDFSLFDPLTGKMRGVIANSYPNGWGAGSTAGGVVNPATRYFLGGFKFDETFGVFGPTDPGNTCGGLEVPVCAHLTNAAWLSLDGIESQWAVASEYITSNDPNNTSRCPGATPAQSTTWGSLKSQYRN